MAFAYFRDAKRVLGVLGKRLARYGLTLHPDKTRFVDFRFERADGPHPETDGTSFTFLGFCHVWGKTRTGGNAVRQVTEADHVAPWRSVYKINLVSDTDVTFLLTSGGHNAGIVSEPGHKHRHFRISHRPSGETYIDPDTWYLSNPSAEGSWWPVWAEWLESKSTGRATPPALGAPDKGYPPLGAAPGQYVLER